MLESVIAGKIVWPRFFKSFHLEHKLTRRYKSLNVRFVVDRPGFDSHMKSYQRHQKQYSLLRALRSAQKRLNEKKTENFACVILKCTQRNFFISKWQTDGETEEFTHRCGPA